MKVVAVVPAYNEQQTIERVIFGLKNAVDVVIVVNDGSSDTTEEIARLAKATVVSHLVNRGQGAALQTGIDCALEIGADIIVTFDADGQHDPADLKGLCRPIQEGKAEVVLGSRFISGENQVPPAKKIMLKVATYFTHCYTGLKITDTHNGLRAFSRQAAERIRITQDGMAHASEILEQIGKLGLRYTEAPVRVIYSEYSLKKGQKLSNSLGIIFDLIINRLVK